MDFFKDLDENVNAICCISYGTLKGLFCEEGNFLKKKKSRVLN